MEYFNMTDAQIICEATAIPYGPVRNVLAQIDIDHSLIQRLSPAALKQYGMTEKMSNRFIALIYSSNRIKLIEENKKVNKKISSPKDIFYLFSDLRYLDHERFYIQALNRNNRLISNPILISIGSLTGTVVDTPKIAKHLIEMRAAAFVCVHNHPSGNAQPSDTDKAITGNIKDMSVIMDFAFLDHLIIADNDYFSFADEGLL